MRIIQIAHILSYGDGIGLAVFDLDKIIKDRGYETKIYADTIDSRISPDIAQKIDSYVERADDIVILHVGGASRLNSWIKTLGCKKVMVYHNITPPHFLEEYSQKAASYCQKGLEEVQSLNKTFDMVLAVSDFNRRDLIGMGYTCKINLLPTLVPLEDYTKKPNDSVLEKYDDDFTNIIFLGRIVPHKKLEDVIAAFASYQRQFNKKSRLFLVGNPTDFEGYDEKLKEFTKRLGAKNVVFTGHTKFDEILAYYKLSDLFLCMSEHEGYCVPLIEAMVFGLPIVAYAGAAVPDTLGGSGFLLKEKNPDIAAGVMNKILSTPELKDSIVRNQKERLQDFTYEKISGLFWNSMEDFFRDNSAK